MNAAIIHCSLPIHLFPVPFLSTPGINIFSFLVHICLCAVAQLLSPWKSLMNMLSPRPLIIPELNTFIYTCLWLPNMVVKNVSPPFTLRLTNTQRNNTIRFKSFLLFFAHKLFRDKTILFPLSVEMI